MEINTSNESISMKLALLKIDIEVIYQFFSNLIFFVNFPKKINNFIDCELLQRNK